MRHLGIWALFLGAGVLSLALESARGFCGRLMCLFGRHAGWQATTIPRVSREYLFHLGTLDSPPHVAPTDRARWDDNNAVRCVVCGHTLVEVYTKHITEPVRAPQWDEETRRMLEEMGPMLDALDPEESAWLQLGDPDQDETAYVPLEPRYRWTGYGGPLST